MRVILIFSFLYVQSVFPQECYPDKIKHKRLVKKIEKLIDKGAYYDAMDVLGGLSGEAVIFSSLRAEVLWRRGDILSAEEMAFKAITICPDAFSRANFILGNIAYERKDYVNADIYLKRALDLALTEPYYADAVVLSKKASALAEIINNPVEFYPEIVNGVSTKDDEYLPVFSPDQEMLFFTRRKDRVSLNAIALTTIEEFSFSEIQSGNFNVGKPLSSPFNMGYNEGGASVTIDNNLLYFTKCIRDDDGYNNCDIYYVYRREDGSWSHIYTFSDSISRVDSWESQPTVSSDGNTIIFASDRIGGYGKMDLYEINRKNGVWGYPRNLGSIINSNEYEKSPYLHPDGKTLFFSSTNFPSLGGFDIFYSRKDSLGVWGVPVNIGYPINSVADDISLFVSTDGDKAYFSSNNLNGVGGWDIYSFSLYDGARPNRVLFVKGSFLDEYGQIVKGVNLEVKNISTKEVTVVRPENGSYVFSVSLSDLDDVLITASKKGFAFNSSYIYADSNLFRSPGTLDFKMQALSEGKSFKIDNVYFENNSYKINTVAREVLVEFAKYLEVNKSLIIEINGFTDNIGEKEYNQLLSENRARVVRDLILEQGISLSRVSYNGFGESFPVSSNDTEGGRSKNRRTEFRIISR